MTPFFHFCKQKSLLNKDNWSYRAHESCALKKWHKYGGKTGRTALWPAHSGGRRKSCGHCRTREDRQDMLLSIQMHPLELLGGRGEMSVCVRTCNHVTYLSLTMLCIYQCTCVRSQGEDIVCFPLLHFKLLTGDRVSHCTEDCSLG